MKWLCKIFGHNYYCVFFYCNKYHEDNTWAGATSTYRCARCDDEKTEYQQREI